MVIIFTRRLSNKPYGSVIPPALGKSCGLLRVFAIMIISLTQSSLASGYSYFASMLIKFSTYLQRWEQNLIKYIKSWLITILKPNIATAVPCWKISSLILTTSFKSRRRFSARLFLQLCKVATSWTLLLSSLLFYAVNACTKLNINKFLIKASTTQTLPARFEGPSWYYKKFIKCWPESDKLRWSWITHYFVWT